LYFLFSFFSPVLCNRNQFVIYGKEKEIGKKLFPVILLPSLIVILKLVINVLLHALLGAGAL